MKTSTTRIVAAALLIVASASTLNLAQAQAAPQGIARTEVQRDDISIPGREAIQVRVDFAPGAGFGRHSHPGEEIAYVLSGELEYRIDGKPPVVLKAGQSLFLPAGTVHAAKNVGSASASELATYIVEKGKPVVVLAK